jgi:hypothetical protein
VAEPHRDHVGGDELAQPENGGNALFENKGVPLNRAAVLYQFGGYDLDNGANSAVQLQLGGDIQHLEMGNLPLADAIDDALLKHGVPAQSVKHLLFTFSGNAPDALLTAALQGYPGQINQWGVGLRVEGHATFIGAVYDKVIANANNA